MEYIFYLIWLNYTQGTIKTTRSYVNIVSAYCGRKTYIIDLHMLIIYII
jgi:hypothetical protein